MPHAPSWSSLRLPRSGTAREPSLCACRAVTASAFRSSLRALALVGLAAHVAAVLRRDAVRRVEVLVRAADGVPEPELGAVAALVGGVVVVVVGRRDCEGRQAGGRPRELVAAVRVRRLSCTVVGWGRADASKDRGSGGTGWRRHSPATQHALTRL